MKLLFLFFISTYSHLNHIFLGGGGSRLNLDPVINGVYFCLALWDEYQGQVTKLISMPGSFRREHGVGRKRG